MGTVFTVKLHNEVLLMYPSMNWFLALSITRVPVFDDERKEDVDWYDEPGSEDVVLEAHQRGIMMTDYLVTRKDFLPDVEDCGRFSPFEEFTLQELSEMIGEWTADMWRECPDSCVAAYTVFSARVALVHEYLGIKPSGRKP